MNTDDKVHVVFRIWNDGAGVLALFPGIAATYEGNYCSSYQHFGQHGSADYNHCISMTRPATEEEYAELRGELESLGYNLVVIRRTSQAIHAKRLAG